ncbi:MAG: twin-arginine translocase subunit TatC [Archaeoglobaceae archaeon]
MNDREMELREHLAELRARLIRVVIATIAVYVVLFFYARDVVEFLWAFEVSPYIFSPIEFLILQLSLTLIVSMIIVYPYAMYELYAFAKPGLYEGERKFLKTVLVSSYVLFLFGFLTSAKFIVPTLVKLSGSYEFYPSAAETMDIVIKISVAMGFFTQIPLVMLLATRFKITSYETLRNLRILVYIAAITFFANSSSLSILATLAATVTFIAMYEFGLVVLRFGHAHRHSRSR